MSTYLPDKIDAAAETLRDIIVSRNLSQGQHRLICPSCSPTRRKSKDPCLSIYIEPHRAMYSCKHCGWEGQFFLRDNVLNFRPKKPQEEKPKPLNIDFETKPPTEAQYRYLEEKRGIPRIVTDHYSLVSATKYFRGLQGHPDGPERVALGFVYHEGEQMTAIKWRCLDKQWTQDGAARSFFGLRQCVSSAYEFSAEDPLIITEGEMDTLSAYAAGFHHAVSVPNGAPIGVSRSEYAPKDDRKYHYLWAAKELIESQDRIYIACDADEQGEALGEELARRIGRAKCWQIRYPEDCKDLNDVLVKHGAEKVTECVRDAEPFPVSGLYTVERYKDAVETLYVEGFRKGAKVNLPELDELYTVVPGMLTVVTGIPSHGKSTFVDWLMYALSKQHGWRHAVCSFENPPAFHIAKLAQCVAEKPFFDGPNERMSKFELAMAMDWVKDHFIFISENDGRPPTVELVLERAKTAVMRYGISGLVIDPYSRLDLQGDDSTGAIGQMLTKVQAFAEAHDVHVWFVAHPKKPEFPDGYIPTGYDISGSAHWFNHTDMGLTVHRPEENSADVDIKVWKVRFENWVGRKGSAELEYQVVTNHYLGRGTRYGEEKSWSESAVRRKILTEDSEGIPTQYL